MNIQATFEADVSTGILFVVSIDAWNEFSNEMNSQMLLLKIILDSVCIRFFSAIYEAESPQSTACREKSGPSRGSCLIVA